MPHWQDARIDSRSHPGQPVRIWRQGSSSDAKKHPEDIDFHNTHRYFISASDKQVSKCQHSKRLGRKELAHHSGENFTQAS